MEQNSKQKTNVSKLILRTIIMIYALVLLITTLFVLACTVKNDNLSFGKYQFYIMKTDDIDNRDCDDLEIKQIIETIRLLKIDCDF